MIRRIRYCLVLVLLCPIISHSRQLRAVKGAKKHTNKQVAVGRDVRVEHKIASDNARQRKRARTLQEDVQARKADPTGRQDDQSFGLPIELPTIELPTIDIPTPQVSIPQISLPSLWNEFWARDPPEGEEANPDFWEEFYWNDLPRQVQNMAEIMGFDQRSWDHGEDWPLLGTPWEDLTSGQQRAAIFMLWTPELWDKHVKEEDDPPVQPLAEFQELPEGFSRPAESIWDDWDWDELPIGVRQYAEDLGYTESIWDDDGRLPILYEAWSDLSPHQQNAAIVLGWIEETWGVGDSMIVVANSENSQSSQYHWSHYYDMWWEEIPPGIQEQFMLLGYTQRAWNHDEPMPLRGTSWSQLSYAQQNAAYILGWTEEMWNGMLISPYDGTDWDDLPEIIQDALITFGHTSYTWDHDIPVSTSRTDWFELTPEEQYAASLLGYAQQMINRAISPIPVPSSEATPFNPFGNSAPSSTQTNEDPPGFFERTGSYVDTIVGFFFSLPVRFVSFIWSIRL